MVNFCPALKPLVKIVFDLTSDLYRDELSKKVFPKRPFVAFRSPRNLKSHLVRAKVSPSRERVSGSKKCAHPLCQTCDNIKECNTFTSQNTQRTFKINHELNCSSNRVIYLLRCKVCELQYVGQTSTPFRERWNNYKAHQRKIKRGEKAPQESFHRHFLQSDHNGLENDCEITLIDKTDVSSPTKREFFWMTGLKTLHPMGLNVEENV